MTKVMATKIAREAKAIAKQILNEFEFITDINNTMYEMDERNETAAEYIMDVLAPDYDENDIAYVKAVEMVIEAVQNALV